MSKKRGWEMSVALSLNKKWVLVIHVAFAQKPSPTLEAIHESISFKIPRRTRWCPRSQYSDSGGLLTL
jgi:hypothetical protein